VVYTLLSLLSGSGPDPEVRKEAHSRRTGGSEEEPPGRGDWDDA